MCVFQEHNICTANFLAHFFFENCTVFRRKQFAGGPQFLFWSVSEGKHTKSFGFGVREICFAQSKAAQEKSRNQKVSARKSIKTLAAAAEAEAEAEADAELAVQSN